MPYSADSIERVVELNASSPSSNGHGWRVVAGNDADSHDKTAMTFQLIAYAICAKV